ncbi:MAG: ATP-binding protein [Gammaproteobacteria bacterium]
MFKPFLTGSFRNKLLLLALTPIVLVIPITLAFVVYWSKGYSDEQLFMRVTGDLAVAGDAFRRIQRDQLNTLGSVADSFDFRMSVENRDRAAIAKALQSLRGEGGFDFLHLTDLSGSWLYEPPPARTSKFSPLAEAAAGGSPGVGLEVFSQDDLLREGLPAGPPPVYGASPQRDTSEDRALVIRALYPVRSPRGQVVALLDGGVSVNDNFDFVDDVRELVYAHGSLPQGARGAVTVFLGDERISTNLQAWGGGRALGTRAPAQVRAQVLVAGETRIDRDFLLRDWYISAYEPIFDVDGQRVGMLHTGFSERPFAEVQYRALAWLLAIFLFLVAVSALFAFRRARSVFEPIDGMTRVVRANQGGADARMGPEYSADEIGEFAREFDRMLDLLQENTRQVRKAADQLELKVAERTHELEEKNASLQETIDLLHQTRAQLVTAEKLAVLGELTAGVAHEINNPTAVILGNMDVLMNELGDKARPVKTEAALIIEQVYRIRSIVDKLLQNTRKSRNARDVERLDVNGVVADTLVLVRHEIESRGARIRERGTTASQVMMNRQELQQVLVNLLVNAIHAAPAGGRVDIETADEAGGHVSIKISDNGPGIPDNQLGRVFDPFYTTKPGGTGLGLSVSYSLVRRYGGSLSVESGPGGGATFTVLLRRATESSEDAVAEDYRAATNEETV